MLASGRAPGTPVALVRNASRPEQSVATLTLAEAARLPSPDPPLVAVIGPGGAPLAGALDPAAAEVIAACGLPGAARRERPASAPWFETARKVLVTGTSAEPYRSLGELVHTPAHRDCGA